MQAAYIQAPGEDISPRDLRIERARSFVVALAMLNYVALVECRRNRDTNEEIVIFDAEVELGQECKNDIRPVERLAVHFDPSDKSLPKVFALREDFPQVPHLIQTANEFPRCLCLYEESVEEAKLRWTAVSLVSRIRDWLALTAKGKLHAEDQPLEPLLLTSPFRLIVPPDFLENEKQGEMGLLTISETIPGDNQETLIAKYSDREKKPGKKIEYVVTTLYGSPQQHGVIRHHPRDLKEVHDLAKRAGIDLLETLRTRIPSWHTENRHLNLLQARLAVVLVLPKSRNGTKDIEAVDVFPFLSLARVLEIGQAIGIWDIRDGRPGALVPVARERKGDSVAVIPVTLTRAFSRDLAARQNGLPRPVDRKIAAVGMGALGSQLFLNLARTGYGEWTLIDNDVLLPHNLARHALTGLAVGYEKATALAHIVNEMFDDRPIAKAIGANIITPNKDTAEPLRVALAEADVILDMSASIPVARHLARDVESPARRVSLFLNPKGTDLVMLAEDEKRAARLDYLEMLYYRHLLNVEAFENHLERPPDRLRYGNSCRDINSTLPQDLVALHAAIGSRALHDCTENGKASITVWRADASTGNVKRCKIPTGKAIEMKYDGWTYCTDQRLLDKVYKARETRLPNETGGVLLGSFDMQRKIAYVMDSLPSPPDSTEWPTVYIRGCQGLKQRVDRVRAITWAGLDYVGEWHSHPPGAGCGLSPDDAKAFLWLKAYMLADGFPALMLIAGDEEYRFYVEGAV